jgi:hexulose-6-phosphate isomerase
VRRIPTLIGVMQGRFSPPRGGKIQSFPWETWREEFRLAAACGFRLIEWTLDAERLWENPLLTPGGRDEIRSLAETYGVDVRSVTGDCFMEAPFYKASGAERQRRLEDLRRVVDACQAAGLVAIVVPLVDQGRLEHPREEEELRAGLDSLTPDLRATGVKVLFESDYPPHELRRFIGGFPTDVYGINYDTGNSASLGFDPHAELAAYGDRIANVHVKDRTRGGPTVPLGTGHADFGTVFARLASRGYAGPLILQPARAVDGDHAGLLCRYRSMVEEWWVQAGDGS